MKGNGHWSQLQERLSLADSPQHTVTLAFRSAIAQHIRKT